MVKIPGLLFNEGMTKVPNVGEHFPRSVEKDQYLPIDLDRLAFLEFEAAPALLPS